MHLAPGVWDATDTTADSRGVESTACCDSKTGLFLNSIVILQWLHHVASCKEINDVFSIVFPSYY